MKWHNFLFLIAANVALFTTSASAGSKKVRAVSIPSIDASLVNNKGLLVGYDDQDLVSVNLDGSNRQILFEGVRYQINLLMLTNSDEVIYSYQSDDNQVVAAISTRKGLATREIFRRPNDYSRVMINHLGDVGIVTRADAGDTLTIFTHKNKTLIISLPENYSPLFLTDYSEAIGTVRSYNQTTYASERKFLVHNYQKRKIKTVESKLIDRSIYTIVASNETKRIFGLAYPVDGDESTDDLSLFALKIPGNKYSIHSTMVDGEELQGVWQGYFSILSAYADDTLRVSRLVSGVGGVATFTCDGLSDLSVIFDDDFATENIALAELRATDTDNSYRIETVVLVPAKNKLGAKSSSQWTCHLR